MNETRWPVAGAVLAVVALTMLLPDSIRPGPPWLLPVFAIALLLSLIVADPSRVNRRSRELRALAIALIAFLSAGSLVATFRLVDELINGGGITDEAGALLSAGVRVWLGNGLSFALLYWELDGRGPANRMNSPVQYPDLAFPQNLNSGVSPPGWKPRFIDYIYLSFTNSLAFSPTDVMPLVPWAKVAMGSQALISFLIVGLVIARAVNVFQ